MWPLFQSQQCNNFFKAQATGGRSLFLEGVKIISKSCLPPEAFAPGVKMGRPRPAETPRSVCRTYGLGGSGYPGSCHPSI